jgi:hypothetical protein
MPFYFFLYLSILLGSLLLLCRFFILKRNPLSTQLFILALKAENNGHLEEATLLYENALVEVKKIRFHLFLKKRIIEKLKLLLTIKKYNKDQHFIRENNSWLPL